MAQVSLGRKAAAEFIGTFWLTFGGCGSAVLAVAFQTALKGVNLDYSSALGYWGYRSPLA